MSIENLKVNELINKVSNTFREPWKWQTQYIRSLILAVLISIAKNDPANAAFDPTALSYEPDIHHIQQIDPDNSKAQHGKLDLKYVIPKSSQHFSHTALHNSDLEPNVRSGNWNVLSQSHHRLQQDEALSSLMAGIQESLKEHRAQLAQVPRIRTSKFHEVIMWDGSSISKDKDDQDVKTIRTDALAGCICTVLSLEDEAGTQKVIMTHYPPTDIPENLTHLESLIGDFKASKAKALILGKHLSSKFIPKSLVIELRLKSLFSGNIGIESLDYEGNEECTVVMQNDRKVTYKTRFYEGDLTA